MLSFTVLVSYVMMNLFVAVILSAYACVQERGVAEIGGQYTAYAHAPNVCFAQMGSRLSVQRRA
jgi:hypothetical protein